MIRCAQAEALLKLAEALEECERNDVAFDAVGIGLFWGERGIWLDLDSLSGVSVRMAIAKLYPKSEDGK